MGNAPGLLRCKETPGEIFLAGLSDRCSLELMITERPRVGQRCWAKQVQSYPLPDGLAARTALTVLEVVYFEVKAVDEAGKVWEVCTIHLDGGQVAWLDGERCHESDAKFALYLRHWLEELKDRLEATRDFQAWRRGDIQDRISEVRWLLERNGFDPDGPLPREAAPRATGEPKNAPRMVGNWRKSG